MQIVIHCGSYKTGSTALQNRLYGGRNELAEDDVLLARTGLAEADADLGRRHHRLAYADDAKGGELDRLLDLLVRELDAAKPRLALLTAEAFCRPDRSRNLRRTVATLREAGHSVTGVLYVRNRSQYARSLYRQWARGRSLDEGFAQFVRGAYREFGLYPMVAGLRAVFGDDLSVIRYEDVGRVDDDFIRRFGLPNLPLIADGERNLSHDAAFTEALRVLLSVGRDRSRAMEEAPLLVARAEAEFGSQTYAESAPESAYPPIDAVRAPLAAALRWPIEQVDDLLRVHTVTGSDVRALTPHFVRWALELTSA